MRLLNIDDFIKNSIKKHCLYVYWSDVKFLLYSHCHQAFIANWLYNGGKSIDVIKVFFLLIAMSNQASFVFQYLTGSILLQLEYLSACNNIGLSGWTHYFPGAIFNEQVVSIYFL